QPRKETEAGKTNRVLNGCKRRLLSRRARSRKKSARSKEKVRRADRTGREQYLGVQTLIALFYSVFGLAWLKVLEFPDRLNSLFRFLDLLNLAKANCRQYTCDNQHDQKDDQVRSPAVEPQVGEQFREEEEKEERAVSSDGARGAEKASTDAALLCGRSQLSLSQLNFRANQRGNLLSRVRN